MRQGTRVGLAAFGVLFAGLAVCGLAGCAANGVLYPGAPPPVSYSAPPVVIVQPVRTCPKPKKPGRRKTSGNPAPSPGSPRKI